MRNAEDIHDALQALPAPERKPEQARPEEARPLPAMTRPGGSLPDQILSQLSPTPLAEDIVIRNCGAQPMQVLAALAELDLTGKIERQPGGMVALAT